MTDKPLAIDLFCGLGGWTEGLLAHGYYVIGFDVERHQYGEAKYPAQMVLQDVLTLHGSQFKDAALIVASPPCQAYSYRAMPWKKAKALPPPDNSLFDACFRIQREACEAAGRHIPLIVENVRGAQKWVGRSRWNFGSFHLWGDVPALMPIAVKAVKVTTMGAGWYPPDHPKHVRGLGFNTHADRQLRADGKKNSGGSWFAVQDGKTQKQRNDPRYQNNPRDRDPMWRRGFTQSAADGMKTSGDAWFSNDKRLGRQGPACHGSKSKARKAASAHIAKIPFALSSYIAEHFHPSNRRAPT